MTSLDFIIGSIIAGLLTLTSLAAITIGVLIWRRDWGYDSDFSSKLWVILGAVLLIVTVTVTAFADYPYNMQYHRYRHVNGTVTAVQPRLVGNSDSTSEYYAVQLADGGTYRCDDSRCALLKPGNRLTMWCIRDWQYASTPGWDCNFDHSERGDAT